MSTFSSSSSSLFFFHHRFILPPRRRQFLSSSNFSHHKKFSAVSTTKLSIGNNNDTNTSNTSTSSVLKCSCQGDFSGATDSDQLLLFEDDRWNVESGKYDYNEISVNYYEEADRKERQRVVSNIGFSFSAAGLLFPYHLGVAHYLLEKGYIKEHTPLAGASAGGIVCPVIASGRSMKDALLSTKVLTKDCRQSGTVFRLGAVLRYVLEDFLPEDIHIRCNGRVRIAITQILWRQRGLLVDQFESKEDVINAVITSCFIPGYLGPSPATIFRNQLCVDGGFTMFMPPTSALHTVRVCALPPSKFGLKGIGISPDCNPENRASLRDLFKWAWEPAEDEVLDWLFDAGYLDAALWSGD